ncbi:MAG TPA: BBE domain-containing protein [Streptosporangiaceae bacterium]|jgi:hypothetical protein
MPGSGRFGEAPCHSRAAGSSNCAQPWTGRRRRYGAFIAGFAPDAGLLAADRDWVRGFWDALRPHAIGSGEGYVNGTADFSGDRVRGIFGTPKHERLARIKAEYDPDNMLHLNANIQPATAMAG